MMPADQDSQVARLIALFSAAAVAGSVDVVLHERIQPDAATALGLWASAERRAVSMRFEGGAGVLSVDVGDRCSIDVYLMRRERFAAARTSESDRDTGAESITNV